MPSAGNDPAAIKRAGIVAMRLGVVLSAILTLTVILARVRDRADFPRRDCRETPDATIDLAATLLAIGANIVRPPMACRAPPSAHCAA